MVGYHAFFTLSLLTYFPAYSVSHGGGKNEPRLPSSLLYSRRIEGVIQPRTSKDPFLEGKIHLLEVASNKPQLA
jgi:hypothetical protein